MIAWLGKGRTPAGRQPPRARWIWPVMLMLGLQAGLSTHACAQAAADKSLTAVAGDVARGRSVVANRSLSMCLLCHSGPIPEQSFQGNLAPDLAGAGTRHTAAQLRQRLLDSRQLNPDSIMPPYFETAGLSRVGPAWQGRTILDAQQIEDVIAYLLSLR